METLKNETEDVLFRKAIKKIPIGYQDPSGKSLTSLVILHSKSPLKHTRLVLQMGYSTTTPDKNGWTPLHHTGQCQNLMQFSFNVIDIVYRM